MGKVAVEEEKIEVEGEAVEALPGTMFRVELDGGHRVLAAGFTVAGGASSPYVLFHDRITSRLR